MKKSIVLASIVAILLSVFAFAGTSVYAFTPVTLSTANGNVNSLTITRNVNGVTNPVTNTFTYTIAEVSKPATATVTGMPTSLTVVFDSEDPDTTTHVATQTATLNLAAVTFDELGDYVYSVTETASTDETTYPLDSKEYLIKISVRNVLSGNTPTGALVATLAAQTELVGETGKADMVFESASVRTYIQITNSVTGNLARLDTYFPFTVTLNDSRIEAGDSFVISTATYASNPTTITATADGSATATIYLKHGETVTIGKDGTLNQLPIGLSYTITEGTDIYEDAEHNDLDNDLGEYTTTIDTSTTAKTVTKTVVATDNAGFTANNTTSFVNNRASDALTGVFINIAPFVALIALAFIGIILIKRTSRKED